MFKIVERAKADLVLKGIINLIGGTQKNSSIYFFFFSKVSDFI